MNSETKISSIRVFGDARVTVYDERDFRVASANLDHARPDLHDWRVRQYLPSRLNEPNLPKSPFVAGWVGGGFSLCSWPPWKRMIRALAIRSNGELMTASAEEDVLVNLGETLGTAAGKVVAAAKRTATTITEEKRRVVRAATKARSSARRVINKTKRKTSKAAKSAKRSAASAKRSVKRVARKLKRR